MIFETTILATNDQPSLISDPDHTRSGYWIPCHYWTPNTFQSVRNPEAFVHIRRTIHIGWSDRLTFRK